jgi:hypothetical protein
MCQKLMVERETERRRCSAIYQNQSFSTKFARGIMVTGMIGSSMTLRVPFPISLTIIPLTLPHDQFKADLKRDGIL